MYIVGSFHSEVENIYNTYQRFHFRIIATPHAARTRTRAAAVGSHRPTALATARPVSNR
jgi:hypothetical protein